MKKVITLYIGILLLIFQSTLFAQLSGGTVYPINGTQNAPVSFQSLRTAITYLTANGITGSGQVILEFQAPYNAAADTGAGTAITIPDITGTSPTLGITIRPGAGFSTMISISVSSTSTGSITLNGASYITIDGRQGGTGAIGLTFKNGRTTNSTALFIKNSSTFNTFKYLNLISGGNSLTSTTVYLLSGGCTDNIIANNNFSAAGGSSASCTYHIYSAVGVNSRTIVSNNNFTNFRLAGIHLGDDSGNNWQITGNSFYSTLPPSALGVESATQSAIDIESDRDFGCYGHNISNNFIGGQAPNCGGAPYTANRFIAIDLWQSHNPSEPTIVQGNVITNFNNTFTETGVGFAGIKVDYGNINILDNTIGNQLDTGAIRINTTDNSATVFLSGIYSYSPDTVRIQNNTIGSITINPLASSLDGVYFRGIWHEYFEGGFTVISNNKIGHNTIPRSIKSVTAGNPTYIQGIFITSFTTVTEDSVRGIYNNTIGDLQGIVASVGASDVAYNISNNIIHNFSTDIASNTLLEGISSNLSLGAGISLKIYPTITSNTIHSFTSSSNANIRGIYLGANVWGEEIYQRAAVSSNVIYNLTNTSSAPGSVVYGILTETTSDSIDINNNLIHSLTSNASGTGVNGICVIEEVYNLNIKNNNIHDLASAAANAASVTGIRVLYGGTISKNKIYNLTNPNTTSAGSISGILVSNGGTYNILNNQVTLGSSVLNNIGIYGIENNSAAGDVNAYHNTFLISGTAAGSNNSAAFIRRNVSSTVDLRNNIFSNVRAGGSGMHVGVINENTTPAAGWNSTEGKNNNNFFVVPASGSVIGLWNAAPLVYDSWKSTTGCDSSSLRAEVTAGASNGYFVNLGNLYTDAAAGNLDIVPDNSEAWYLKGNGVPLAIVSDDINSNPRSTTIAGGATCIGANEFDPSSEPLPAAASGLPALNTTSTYSIGGKTIAGIKWGGTGTVPAALDFQFYSGRIPPSSAGYNTGSGYIDIQISGGSGYTYDLGWYYQASNMGSIPADTNVIIAKSENGGALYTPYLTYGTGAGEYERNSALRYIVLHGLTDFSLFALADNDMPLPVELASFTSSVNRNNVNLKWSTVSEANNSGFDIERKNENGSWSKITNVQGHGTTSTANNYSFEDKNLLTGKYNYRLKQIDYNGSYKYYDLQNEVVVGVPAKFELGQNYPNPFNPSTKINYELPSANFVTLKIYDMTGREVMQLVNELKQAGYYSVNFNASVLSSGVYFYKIQAGDFSGTKKMMLIK